MQRTQVQSLLRELRSPRPRGTTKQTPKKELNTKQNKKAEVAALIYNIADFGARKLSGIKKGIT